LLIGSQVRIGPGQRVDDPAGRDIEKIAFVVEIARIEVIRS
jgi:hypothetical protein